MFFNNVKHIDAVFQEPLSSQKIFYSSVLSKMIKIFEYSLSLEDTLPIFIVGEIGAGKSIALQILYNHAKKTHQTYFLPRPFPDMDTYIEFLSQLNHIPYEKGMDGEAIISAMAKTTFQPTVLLIDAFELMSYEQMTLTFQLKNIPFLTIVCATRTHEAEKIFNNKTFQVNHKVSFSCSPLSSEDIKKYIDFILGHSQETSYSKLFTASICTELHYYTRGNWQVLNKFLHTLFKRIVYENIIGNTVEKLSSLLLAKIAFEQKILNNEGFRKKCLLRQAFLSLNMFGSVCEIMTIFALIVVLFLTHHVELNATIQPHSMVSEEMRELPKNTYELDNESLKTVFKDQEYQTLILHVRFPSQH